MFDLAREMVRLGQEVRLYTGYPRFKIDKDLTQIADTRPFWTVAMHLRLRLPPAPRTTWWGDRTFEDFGPWLARRIRDVDILDAIEGTGWEAGRVMHEAGKPWICNRASTHILVQKALLEAEHRRWDVPPPYFSMGRPLDRCIGEYSESDAIVVPSQFAKRSFLEHGIPAGKVYVCPLGVDLSMFHRLPKEDGRFRLLFVGTASLRKGIGDLFDAVRPLVKRDGVEVWLIGHHDPSARDLLSKNADIFVDKGAHPRGRLSWFYSQGSVLVLPSIEDGFGLVLAQAMACGIPVIASSNTGGEDLFADGQEGFIVPIRSPEAIREKICWMLDNPSKREEMGQAALQRVKIIGGWNAYGERCLAIYREVLNRYGWKEAEPDVPAGLVKR
jgi:glycosyltransferase involved in cell wall biosynthesis